MADEDVTSRPTTNQSKGGVERAKSLSSKDRREIARSGALARWGGSLPRAINEGSLVIGKTEIKAAVLSTGKRLISQESFLGALGRSRPTAGTGSGQMGEGGTGNLPPFLAAANLKPFISDELLESTTPIMFIPKNGGRAFGFDALLLPKVCEVYLKLNDAGATLPPQRHIVKAAYTLMRGLAHVGIIALVDEATGYQEARAKDELIKILEQYISPELLPWVRKFPEEFFREIYRIHGWEYKPGTTKRTPQVGKLINKYVYE
ncbi:MAG TPA: P63C domain-containing protein, partial [Thermoanaerobaculia bacterium]